MELRLIQSPGNNRGRSFVLVVTAVLDTVTRIVTVRPVDWPVSQDRRDPMHPKERRSAATRREFLAGTGGLPLARPNRRVTLPLWEQPIPSGMKPETGGEFTIFNYPEYIYGALLKEFGKKYNVTVKVTPFDDINTGVAKLASGAVQPDVTEMTPDNLDRVVAGHLIKPLNLDYIPNLKKNVWPSLVDPFYDVGSQYGVPYTAYATGIAWRTDQVKVDIPSMSNPWDIFWQAH